MPENLCDFKESILRPLECDLMESACDNTGRCDLRCVPEWYHKISQLVEEARVRNYINRWRLYVCFLFPEISHARTHCRHKKHKYKMQGDILTYDGWLWNRHIFTVKSPYFNCLYSYYSMNIACTKCIFYTNATDIDGTYTNNDKNNPKKYYYDMTI